jgi:hypothetical protein
LAFKNITRIGKEGALMRAVNRDADPYDAYINIGQATWGSNKWIMLGFGALGAKCDKALAVMPGSSLWLNASYYDPRAMLIQRYPAGMHRFLARTAADAVQP